MATGEARAPTRSIRALGSRVARARSGRRASGRSACSGGARAAWHSCSGRVRSASPHKSYVSRGTHIKVRCAPIHIAPPFVMARAIAVAVAARSSPLAAHCCLQRPCARTQLCPPPPVAGVHTSTRRDATRQRPDALATAARPTCCSGRGALVVAARAARTAADRRTHSDSGAAAASSGIANRFRPPHSPATFMSTSITSMARLSAARPLLELVASQLLRVTSPSGEPPSTRRRSPAFDDDASRCLAHIHLIPNLLHTDRTIRCSIAHSSRSSTNPTLNGQHSTPFACSLLKYAYFRI